MERLKRLWPDRAFLHHMLILALPIILQQFMGSALNMMDTWMVGSLGDVELAGVGVGNQFYFLYSMVSFGISGGCTMFVSQFWGQRDGAGARRVVGIGLAMMIGIGLAITLVGFGLADWVVRWFTDDAAVIRSGRDYLRIVCWSYPFIGISQLLAGALRATDRAVAPMVVSGVAIVLNIVLNYIFIFGKLGMPAMGVRGAALATLIARILEAGCMMLLTFREGSPLFGPIRGYFA